MTTEVQRNRIIAEYDGIGWLVMYPDGTVKGYRDEDDTLHAIKWYLEKQVRKLGADVLITEVEWRR